MYRHIDSMFASQLITLIVLNWNDQLNDIARMECENQFVRRQLWDSNRNVCRMEERPSADGRGKVLTISSAADRWLRSSTCRKSQSTEKYCTKKAGNYDKFFWWFFKLNVTVGGAKSQLATPTRFQPENPWTMERAINLWLCPGGYFHFPFKTN